MKTVHQRGALYTAFAINNHLAPLRTNYYSVIFFLFQSAHPFGLRASKNATFSSGRAIKWTATVFLLGSAVPVQIAVCSNVPEYLKLFPRTCTRQTVRQKHINSILTEPRHTFDIRAFILYAWAIIMRHQVCALFYVSGCHHSVQNASWQDLLPDAFPAQHNSQPRQTSRQIPGPRLKSSWCAQSWVKIQ